jgi:hypothetical protein
MDRILIGRTRNKAQNRLAFLQSLLELRLAESVRQSDEHNPNEQLSLGNFSPAQTQLFPDSRELATPSKSYIYTG